MKNMRKDHIAGHFFVASEKSEPIPRGSDNPYVPGNEDMTSASVLSLVDQSGIIQRSQDADDERVKGWSIRVFESSNPVVSVGEKKEYGDMPHYSEPAYGYHYVVVPQPENDNDLASIDVDRWSSILMAVQDRMRWLYTQKGVTYVAVYADHGNAAGSDNAVPHLNLVTLSAIPPVIAAEAQVTAKTANEKDECPICQILGAEIDGPRQLLRTDGFVAFCPWSPRHMYEFWIVPRKHTTLFTKNTQKDLNDLAWMIRATLGGLARMIDGISYSMVFHLSPETKKTRHIHWHVEVYPITEAWSGLERGYGIFVNSVSPEKAAAKLGAACRREVGSMEGII